LLAAGNALAGAGLDVYEDQFLFGADNVYSVQAMTMRALSAHQTDIDSAELETFDSGVRALLDHQSICTPGNILELVRASIDNGDFVARKRDGEGEGGTSGEGGNGEEGFAPQSESEQAPASTDTNRNAIPLSLPPVG